MEYPTAVLSRRSLGLSLPALHFLPLHSSFKMSKTYDDVLHSQPSLSYLPETPPASIAKVSSTPPPPPPSPPATAPVTKPLTGMQAAPAIEAAVIATAKLRADRPVDQTFFLSFIAGIWLGFGAIGALSAACGVPQSVRTEWPILPKFLMGAIFAFGACMRSC